MEGSTVASGNATEIKPSKPLKSNIFKLITASVTVQATSHLTAVIVIVAAPI
jgi:hypothetical protein